MTSPVSQRPISAPSTRGGGAPPVLPPEGAGAGPVGLQHLTLLGMAAFAAIGFVRGARREWLSLAATALGYVAVEAFWEQIARWMNHFWRLFSFAVLRRGVLADDPSAAWRDTSGTAAPIPTESTAAIWQIAVFLAIVLAGYLGSHLVGRGRGMGPSAAFRLPDLVERLIGALMGAGSGYIIATFLLARLYPETPITLLGPSSQMPAVLGRLGAPGLFGIVALLILFGVLSLGSRGRQVYGQ